MNGISTAELRKSELEVDSDKFTETRRSINLHPKPLLGVMAVLRGEHGRN